MSPFPPVPTHKVPVVIAGVVPATVLVVLACLLVFVALFLDADRRRYAERVFTRAVDLAEVLLGAPRPPAGDSGR